MQQINTSGQTWPVGVQLARRLQQAEERQQTQAHLLVCIAA